MTKPRAWGAFIEGETIDLDYWARALKQPSDPWIEMHGQAPVLRSASLDGLSHAEEVRDRCVAHIERLNGAVALAYEKAKPVRFGSVVEVGPNGVLHRTISPPAGQYEIRGSAVVVEIRMLGPDGKPIEPPSLQSEVQAWAEHAEAEPLLDDALIYFGRGAEWFDIYKAFECIEERFGGEGQLLTLGWWKKKELKLLKRTANAARHARKVVKSPRKPMGIEQAHELVGTLLRRAFNEAPNHPAPIKPARRKAAKKSRIVR